MAFRALSSKPQAVLARVEELLRADAAKHSAPAVVWVGIDETPEHFTARVKPLCDVRRRILAVCPFEFELPTGVQRVELPREHFELLHPARTARYRIAYGGRASAKSWSIAIVLVLEALVRPVRVLCAREFQNSLDESVLKLLATVIERLDLLRYFTVYRDSIASHCGAAFAFAGLRNNVSKIRSYEGIDRCWCEEAVYISEDSWRVLTPTIRTPGSQFYVSFNPDAATDPTYKRFVSSAPEGTLAAFVNADGNPWLTEEMRQERDHLRRVDPDAAAWIWDGQIRVISNAVVFAGKYITDDFTPSEAWDGPYFGLDLGFAADPSVLTKSWVYDNRLYIEREAWQLHCDIDKLPQLLDQIPGSRTHAIRVDSSRPETISYLKQHGFPDVVAVDKWPDSVADGIARMRAFEQIVLHPSCEHAAQEFRLYSHKTDRLTHDVLPDIVDRWNHCVDSIRYAIAPLIRRPAGQGLIDFYNAQLTAEAAAKAINTANVWQPARLWNVAERQGGKVEPL